MVALLVRELLGGEPVGQHPVEDVQQSDLLLVG
jgi:hypothetical protein